jgi:signal transduction histidine kinase
LFPFPANGLLCFFQIVISIALQKVGYVFELHLPEIPLSDIIAFTLVLAFAGFLSCVYGIQKSRINNQEERIVYLKSALSKISQINIGFQKYAVQAGRKTIMTERKRLSREIHDSIGYILTNVLMMVKTSILLAPPSESSLKELLTKISLHAEEGIVEIRSTLHELRNQKFAREHGIMAITKLVKVFSDATGIKVDIEYGNTGNGFTPVIELFIYRMCQEGMLNAFNHGNASYIRILFWRTDTHIHVSIFDNGKSNGVFTKGIGLRGMEERAGRLGGEVRILANSSGFELLALIPLKKETGDYE